GRRAAAMAWQCARVRIRRESACNGEGHPRGSVVSGSSVLDALRRVPLFAELDPEADAAVADAVERMPVRVGEALIVQGDASDALYVVLRGRFVVERSGD